MTPQQRIQKAFELSDMTRELLMRGLRQRFPDATPEEFRRILLEVLDRCHNTNY